MTDNHEQDDLPYLDQEPGVEYYTPSELTEEYEQEQEHIRQVKQMLSCFGCLLLLGIVVAIAAVIIANGG
jgi:hypothetical protein